MLVVSLSYNGLVPHQVIAHPEEDGVRLLQAEHCGGRSVLQGGQADSRGRVQYS